MSWMTAEQALVLGTAPCANAGGGTPPACTYVVGTSNGGSSWRLAGTVKASLSDGVRAVDVPSAKVAWLFAPELWLSTNQGGSWKMMPIPGGGKQVVSVVGNANETFAMVGPCPFGRGGSCATKPYTVWSTPTPTPGNWTELATDLTPPKGLLDADAGLSAYASTVYAFASVSGPEGFPVRNLIEASTDGTHFSMRTQPCMIRGKLAQNLVQMVATSSTDVALLCEGPPSVGHSSKPVHYSTDTAIKDTSAGAPSTAGTDAQMAASPSRKLAVSSASGASYIDINDTGGTAWTRVVNEPDGGQGWNDIVYVSGSVAWVIYAPSTDPNPEAAGQLWITRNAGRRWSAVSW